MGVDHRRNISNLKRIESKISQRSPKTHMEFSPGSNFGTRWGEPNKTNRSKFARFWEMGFTVLGFSDKKEVKEAKSVLTVRGCWCIFSEFEFGKGRRRRWKTEATWKESEALGQERWNPEPAESGAEPNFWITASNNLVCVKLSAI